MTDVHDDLCEHDPNATTAKGLSCECASRAWLRDPLPDDLMPIYAEQKPRLEGTP